MIDVHSLIDRLDATFNAAKPTEKAIMYMLPAVVFLFISFNYLVPYTKGVIQREKLRVQELEIMLLEDKNYLLAASVGKARFAQTEEKNAKLSMQLEDAKQKNAFLKERAADIGGVLYSQQGWTDFMDTLSNIAATNKITIGSVANSFSDTNRSVFTKAMTIDINASGELGSIVRFIDEVERAKLLVEVGNVVLEGGKSIQMKLRLYVWGVEL